MRYIPHLTHTSRERKVEKNGVRLTLFSVSLELSRSSEVKSLTPEEQGNCLDDTLS